MFAAPRDRGKKQEVEKKKIFQNNGLEVVNREIMKKSSVRTFQPFLDAKKYYSAIESNMSSMTGSEENYKLREKEKRSECFQTEMEMIDECLKSVLETIRAEKAEISLKIITIKTLSIEMRKQKTKDVMSKEFLNASVGTNSNPFQIELQTEIDKVDSACQTDINNDKKERAQLMTEHLSRLQIEDGLSEEKMEQIMSSYELQTSQKQIDDNKILLQVLLHLLDQ